MHGVFPNGSSKARERLGAGAEMLELIARTALIEVMQDVREVQARQDTLTEDERRAFRQLTGMAAILMALAFFARHLKAKLAGRSAGLNWAGEAPIALVTARLGNQLRSGPAYLDSS